MRRDIESLLCTITKLPVPFFILFLSRRVDLLSANTHKTFHLRKKKAKSETVLLLRVPARHFVLGPLVLEVYFTSLGLSSQVCDLMSFLLYLAESRIIGVMRWAFFRYWFQMSLAWIVCQPFAMNFNYLCVVWKFPFNTLKGFYGCPIKLNIIWGLSHWKIYICQVILLIGGKVVRCFFRLIRWNLWNNINRCNWLE